MPPVFRRSLPLTLLDLLTSEHAYLREQGVASARLDAELLLGHCVELDRVGLYCAFDRPVSEDEQRVFRALVRRRACGEPVAYITGRRDFWTLTLEITPGVLIPRPDTEVLVEHALSFLRARQAARPRVLDIGTGSGAIALALAAELPGIDVVALDASVRAADCARANAVRLGFTAGVSVVHGVFPHACQSDARPFDLIVSNPPYIAGGDIEGLDPDIRDYEPRAALDGGEDGLDAYRSWIPHCARLLLPGGALMLETGHEQAAAVSALIEATGAFSGIEIVRDYAGCERVVMCRREA